MLLMNTLAGRKMIPWWQPQLGPLESEFVQEVLQSNYLNEGDVTAAFERQIAELVGAKHAVAVSNGTSALCLSLKGLGIGHGDEVIVPDITFIASANAVVLAGAKPVLVDVNSATLNMLPEAMARAITSRTKAVMPVHVSGRAADLSAILEIAKKFNLSVVEDAAEAFMSRTHGKFLGTFGKAGCFSFSPNKTITTGQGGMIVTDDDALHGRLLELKDQGRPVRGSGGDDIHASIGFNFKLTNLQAAVGLAQLSSLSLRLERLKMIYRRYSECLRGLKGISLLGFRIEEGESPQWVDALIDERNALDQYLTIHDVHCRRFWFPIHAQRPFWLPDDTFPNSTRLSPHAIWLPSALCMSDEDVTLVCHHIRKFLMEPVHADND